MSRSCNTLLATHLSPFSSAGVVFFLYGIAVSAAIQLFVLPYVLPGIHAGHGLLAGGDYPVLHEIAVRMASRIQQEGWSAWELLPSGQAAAGLASAAYALTYPEPWVLIPLNAALHAMAGLIVMRLVQILSGNSTIAFWGGALYICFPSSLQWVSQIQKDSTYIAGMLAVLLGLVTLIHAASRKTKRSELVMAVGLVLLGLSFTGIARLYGFELITVVSSMIAILITPSLFKRWQVNEISNGRLAVVIVTLVVTLFVGRLLPRDVRINAELPDADPSTLARAHLIVQEWHPTNFVPEIVARTFLRIGVARYGWSGPTYASAGSMIDTDVIFRNERQVIEYLPRALQIGFLAPFPEHWLAQGSSPGGTMMRRVTGIEMIVLYPLFLVGLPLAAWRWRRRLEFWMIVFFCVPIVIAYTLTIPNLGTLHRLRYGFLMPLAAVGLAAIWLSLKDWQSRNSHSSPA